MFVLLLHIAKLDFLPYAENMVISLVFCFCPLLLVCVVLRCGLHSFQLKYAFWAILLGLASVIPIAIIQFCVLKLPLFQSHTLMSILVTAILFNGLIEESVKLLCMLPIPSHNMTVSAFFATAMLCGMALGCFETAVYFISGVQQITLRIATAVVIHSACAVLSGAYIWINRQGGKTVIPFVFAVLLHGIYNFFAGFENSFWWFSVIVLLFTVLECRIWYQRAAQPVE